MNVSELKIGNIVYAKNDVPAIVESILRIDKGRYEVLLRNIHNNSTSFYNVEDVKPCPLVTIYFIKAGFGFLNVAWRRNINDYMEYFFDINDRVLRLQTQRSGHTTRLEHVKYVHQLQNFHYSYTGEELNFN